MCGITGFFLYQDDLPLPKDLLERMNRVQSHRGPDDEGYFRENPAGLAMRRLKVIDLATGNQPMSTNDKSLWIIFNGEIYNYRELRDDLIQKGHQFKTQSDTEVLLHLYQEKKEACLQDLAGMFAFAVYDTREKSLFIARDRLGIKPLFYHEAKEGVAFASELKSILEAPWVSMELAPQALSHFFSLNYLPPPYSPVKGIRQLPPGHWMKISKSGISLRQYWDIPSEEPLEISEEEAVEQIWKRLHKSMERRLIADVPIGTFLSGGLDSSTLVYLMKEHRQGAVKTFSVGFADEGFDETPYAREVANTFGTDHHEIVCKSEDAVSLLPKIAWHADGLLGDQAALPLYMVSKLAREHVTVCLSGDGGDEIFVGYPTFQANRYRSIFNQMPGFIRSAVAAGVRSLPASSGKLSFEYKAKKFIDGASLSALEAHYGWRTIFNRREKENLLAPDFRNHIPHPDAYEFYEKAFRQFKGQDFVNQCLYADMKVWLVGNNLSKVDTMSMAHGLEARVPFLDHELVETMMRLSGEMKFKNGKLKSLMKKMLTGRLPDSIVNRPKAGFHAPVGNWLKGPLKDYAAKIFKARNPLFNQAVRSEAAAGLLEEHAAGIANHTFKLWGLLVFWHWADQFGSK